MLKNKKDSFLARNILNQNTELFNNKKDKMKMKRDRTWDEDGELGPNMTWHQLIGPEKKRA